MLSDLHQAHLKGCKQHIAVRAKSAVRIADTWVEVLKGKLFRVRLVHEST